METPRKRILIVDEDPLIQEVLRLFLAELDYEVIVTGAVDMALMQLKNGAFDILIFDLELGEGSGEEILHSLGVFPLTSPSRVIVLSSDSQAMMRSKYGDKISAILSRPVNCEALLREIGPH